ncbi:hypothetical protein ABPG74_006130 [Tetrahymena malaccensis]
MDASTLRAGTTRANMQMSSKAGLKSGPTMAGKKLAGGTTRLPQGSKSSKQAGQSKMKTTGSERDNEYVMEGNVNVTPKRLITQQMKELAQEFQKHEQEQAEKQKKLKQSFKPQTSLLESSMRSAQQSVDKSSGSENKTSSANIKESSMMDSSRRSEIYSESEEESRLKEEREKKAKKAKQLSEDDKEKDVIINLQESETEILLYIPSSLVSSSSVQVNQNQVRDENTKNPTAIILERNQKYEQHCQDIIGSDKFSKRAAQTFKYAPKQQQQQSNRIERAEKGVFAAVWDLYDAQLQEQYNEYEQLQNEIQKNIDLELKKALKNPFCLLPLDVKSINLHSRAEVPGDTRLLTEKMSSKTYKPGHTASVNNNTLNPSQDDTGPRDSSFSNLKDVSGTKLKRQFESQNLVTKSYGGNKVHHEQMLKQHKETLEILKKEEQKLIEQRLEKVKNQINEEEQKIISSDSLSTYLKYVDRILNQNTYHKQYILYRNYPEVKIHKRADDEGNKRFNNMRIKRMKQGNNEDEDEEKEKKKEVLEFLFKFNCDITQDRTVSCADWNPVNKDLLACTYGELDLNVNRQGMVMFWTLKNPSYPERIIKTKSRLTSCKFSEMNPNLLATGSYDGIVAIYDIRKKGNQPILCNDQTEGKHSDAIWELNWIGKGNKGNEKGESLVSISSDGRIVEWNMKKELENTELMSLKKTQNPSSKEQANEGTNFRQAAGFSMDFIRGEYSTYLAATDDGPIHRCSKNYSGQYLESYFGHTGPVYRVRFNPFWSDIFLSCSADWSCRLWNIKEEQPLSTFQSLDLQDEVMDVEWSPNCSTLFASVAKDGRMELWDLTKNNMLDPFAQIIPKNNEPPFPPKTMVRFAQSAPVIITGDIAGDLNVYRLHGYEDSDPKVQHDRLLKLLYPSGYTKGVKDTTEVE